MVNSPIKSPFWMVNCLKNIGFPGLPARESKAKASAVMVFCRMCSNLEGNSFYPSVFVGDFSCWFHDGLMGFYCDLMMISYWLMEVSMGFYGDLFNDGLMGIHPDSLGYFWDKWRFPWDKSEAWTVPSSRQGAAARPTPSHGAAARSAARWRSPRCLRWKPRCLGKVH